jgi:hypothetical protein
MTINREEIIYKVREQPLNGNKIRSISENFEEIMKRLGGRVINSTCILLDGVATEAYGYYNFPNLGVVIISLKYNEGLSVNIFGFENKTEEYNNIKKYIEHILEKAGLNKVNIK